MGEWYWRRKGTFFYVNVPKFEWEEWNDKNRREGILLVFWINYFWKITEIIIYENKVKKLTYVLMIINLKSTSWTKIIFFVCLCMQW